MAICTKTYLPWFIISELPGLNPGAIKRLLERFPSPGKILKASRQELSMVSGLRLETVTAILDHKKLESTAYQRLEQISQAGYKVVAYTDATYPVLLKEIPDPPPLLFYEGTMEANAPCISLVGSRNATRYGMDTARYLAARLAQAGFTVVSGMALGVDTAAHNGALETDNGSTLAVLGSGLANIYPRQNKTLYQRIKSKGAVISEFFPEMKPLPVNFPRRNRIIAGLSCGTVVVEAASKSGSLITARLAGEFNREVFAVPGSIRSSKSRGTHHLIKQGARLVENELDIMDELSQFVHPAKPQSITPETPKPAMDKIQTMVYKHLELYPRHIDQITASSGLTSAQVLSVLLDLELSGLIVRHPGNNFSTLEE